MDIGGSTATRDRALLVAPTFEHTVLGELALKRRNDGTGIDIMAGCDVMSRTTHDGHLGSPPAGCWTVRPLAWNQYPRSPRFIYPYNKQDLLCSRFTRIKLNRTVIYRIEHVAVDYGNIPRQPPVKVNQQVAKVVTRVDRPVVTKPVQLVIR